MGLKPVTPAKNNRKWVDFAGAFGRAHRKASVKLESSAPLLEHLNELRVRIFRSFFALLVATAISFFFSEQIIQYLATPIGGIENLVSIDLTENVSIFMKVSMLGGFVLSMPVIIYQIMAFIIPGLQGSEGRWVALVIPFGALLFLGGVAFTWFVMLPSAIPFLQNFMGITTQIRPENYFDFITRLMFWIGICFEMPLLVLFLAKMNLISATQLANGWRYALVAMSIIAAAVTPTVDPINMGLVMAPLMGLYIISIMLAGFVGRGSNG